MRSTRGRAGILVAGGLLVVGLVAGCAGTAIAGKGGPGGSPLLNTPGSGGTITQMPPSGGMGLDGCPAVPDDDAPPATPTGPPMITITQGTNAWIASDLTQPFAIAVYPDGTAIRSEDQGILSEPLPDLTIGRLSGCHLQEAVGEIQRLAGADFGEATVTDQGTTTITLHSNAVDVVIQVYALGVGDQSVTDDQRAARERVTAMIASLAGGLTHPTTWIPDRLRVTRFGNPVDPTTRYTWPLPGTIDSVLTDRDSRRPCGIVSGTDSDAIRAELGTGDAGSSWTDGTQTVVLAVGVLVPGQDCPAA